VIFRDELERREGTRRDKTIAGYTRSIFWLTVIIAIATLVSVLDEHEGVDRLGRC
jgi:hypothetical protein